jgi:hypothetical protein
MSDTPTARRRQILELLDTRRMVTVQELVAELGVSAMTVHRDLDRLAGAGYLAKTRGGATLPSPATHDSSPGDLCAMCNRLVLARTSVIIQSPRRGRLSACCPHCGLALVDLGHSTDLMLVTDFLYCRMISASEAVYLVGSEVSSCCSPGVLAFACLQDAMRFQRGFGGEVMDSMQAQNQLRHRMSMPVRLELS